MRTSPGTAGHRPTRPTAELERVDHAFVLVSARLDAFTDADARGASFLPGWSRGHVLTHLARNADGQRRMVEGALRGEALDQYPGGDARRTADIETGASRPGAELIADVHDSQVALVRAWSQMPDDAWGRLTHARAGDRPVADGAFSRWRELLVHLVDLDLGFTVHDLPADYRARDKSWLDQFRPTWT